MPIRAILTCMIMARTRCQIRGQFKLDVRSQKSSSHLQQQFNCNSMIGTTPCTLSTAFLVLKARSHSAERYSLSLPCQAFILSEPYQHLAALKSPKRYCKTCQMTLAAVIDAVTACSTHQRWKMGARQLLTRCLLICLTVTTLLWALRLILHN